MGKKIIISLTLLFFLCLGLLGISLSWLATHPAELRGWIRQQTGLIVEVDSFELLLSPFPFLRLRAENIEMHSEEDLSTVLDIEQLSVVVNLRELLLGRFTIEALIVQRGHFDLNLSEQGQVQLGTWVLPWGGQSKGWNLLQFHLQRLQVSGGKLKLRFPASWQMPEFQFFQTSAKLNFDEGKIQLNTELEWGGKQGKLAGRWEQNQGTWHGHYQLENIPLHPLTIPGVPKVFPPMPVQGALQLTGRISQTQAGQWISHNDWNVSNGKILNPQFQTKEMPLLAFSGKLDFLANPEEGATIEIELGEAQTLLGKLEGTVGFDFPRGAWPVMRVDVQATGWDVNESKPYIFGFMPPIAGDWIRTHIHDGQIEQAHFDLRWEMNPQFEDVNDVLHLNLRSELSGVKVIPFENIPAVEDIHGHLHLGLWGLGVEADHGIFQGSQLDGGVFSIGYGAPVVTPLKLEIYGKTNVPQTWPLILSIWGDAAPLLRQMAFQGEAAVRFFLEDDNMLDEQPLDLGLQIFPQQMGFQWQTAEQTYQLENIEGEAWVTLNEIRWENLKFNSFLLNGQTKGWLPFLSQQSAKMEFQLESLEQFLPTYENPNHPFAQWFPQQLSAEVEVERIENTPDAPQWQFKVVATDEQAQQLQLEAIFRENHWEIPFLEGKLGQIEATETFENQQEIFDLKIAPLSATPLDLTFQWKKNHGVLAVQTPSFQWQDWLGWKIPEAFEKLPLAGNGSLQLKLDFQTKAWRLSPTKNIPLHFSGTLDLGKKLALNLPQVKLGDHIGHVAYQGTLEQGTLRVDWKQLNLALVKQLKEYFQQSIAPYFSNSPPTSKSKGLFSKVAVALHIEEFQLFESVGVPLQTNFSFQKETQGFVLIFNDFLFQQQQAKGQLRSFQDQLEIQIEGQRIDVLPWIKLVQHWNMEATTANAPSPSAIQTIAIDFQTERLYFDENLQFPATFQIRLDWPSASSEEPLQLTLEHFDLFESEGTGLLLWNPSAPRVDLRFTKLDLTQWIDHIGKISQLPWESLGFQKQETTWIQQLGFSLELVPEQLALNGQLQWNFPNYQIKIAHLKWEAQEGNLSFAHQDNQFKILGKFAYFDIQKWKTLQNQIQQALNNLKENKESQEPPPQERFTFQFPKSRWFVDIEIQKIKFLRTIFEKFVFKGELNEHEIRLPKLSWKKDGKQDFALAGNLKRLSQKKLKDFWKGTFSAEIADLGEILELYFGNNSTVVRQYPISGGQSHVQADIQLLPAGKARWKPEAKVRFQSREGIIKKGENLIFLLAAFSIQSYLKVAQGKLSGFENEGLVYSAIKSDLQITGGVFEIKNFLFDSPNIRFVASGMLDYEQNEEELLICLQPFETLDLFLSHIPLINLLLTSQSGAFIELCYQSSGTLDNPTLIPLPQSLIPGRIRDLLIYGFSDIGQTEE